MSPPIAAIVTASSNSGGQAALDLITKYAGSVAVRACFRSQNKADEFTKPLGEGQTKHLQVVVGIDAEKPETLEKAFRGARYAVIVTPTSASFDKDAELSENMVRAAKQFGVEYVIYVGSWTATPECAGCSEDISKRFRSTEELLQSKDIGLKFTVLRSGYFSGNFLALAASIKQGSVRFPNVTVPPVDPRDMGRVAAAILGSGDADRHHGQFYQISGPEELTIAQVIDKISAKTGKPIQFEATPAGDLQYLPGYLKSLLTWMENNRIPFSTATKEISGVHTTFDEWLNANVGAFV